MFRRVDLVRTDVVPSSPILVTMTMEALSSSEPSVHTSVTQHSIQKTVFFKVPAVKTSNLT
jgi:hypothetical protein